MSRKENVSDMHDDRIPDMKERSWNHGREKFSADFSQEIQMDYGLDRSSLSGKTDIERGPMLNGSTTDLSHSLSGGSAQQAEDKRGKKDDITYP